MVEKVYDLLWSAEYRSAPRPEDMVQSTEDAMVGARVTKGVRCMYEVVGEGKSIAAGDRFDFVRDIRVPRHHGRAMKAADTCVDDLGHTAMLEMGRTALKLAG